MCKLVLQPLRSTLRSCHPCKLPAHARVIKDRTKKAFLHAMPSNPPSCPFCSLNCSLLVWLHILRPARPMIINGVTHAQTCHSKHDTAAETFCLEDWGGSCSRGRFLDTCHTNAIGSCWPAEICAYTKTELGTNIIKITVPDQLAYPFPLVYFLYRRD